MIRQKKAKPYSLDYFRLLVCPIPCFMYVVWSYKKSFHIGTGFFYVTKKNPRYPYKLQFRKYDPVVQRHVLFEEKKIK